jgi:hypothetical protein
MGARQRLVRIRIGMMTMILAMLFAVSLEGGRVRAANRPQMPPPVTTAAVDGDWSIEITTTGGIAGHGFGDMHADSTGKLVVSQSIPTVAKCEYRLTPTELADLKTLIGSLRADLWYSSYQPADQSAWCCDMFFVTVRLQRQERDAFDQLRTITYTTQFINEQTLPVARDLRAAVRQLWSHAEPESLLNKYLIPCGK